MIPNQSIQLQRKCWERGTCGKDGSLISPEDSAGGDQVNAAALQTVGEANDLGVDPDRHHQQQGDPPHQQVEAHGLGFGPQSQQAKRMDNGTVPGRRKIRRSKTVTESHLHIAESTINSECYRDIHTDPLYYKEQQYLQQYNSSSLTR